MADRVTTSKMANVVVASKANRGAITKGNFATERVSSGTIACTVDTPVALWERICAFANKHRLYNRAVWLAAVEEYLNKNE